MDWNDEDDFDEEEYADLYADEDEAAELDLQQDIESEAESVDLSRFESSAEKNVFSRRNRIWVRRAVSKPRRHRKSDEKGDWSEAAFPDSLDHFRDQGRNAEALAIKMSITASSRSFRPPGQITKPSQRA